MSLRMNDILYYGNFTVIAPFHCGFSFVFGRGVSFFDGFQRPPVSGCSTASCDFGALAGGDELTSFYCAMLNLNPRSEF